MLRRATLLLLGLVLTLAGVRAAEAGRTGKQAPRRTTVVSHENGLKLKTTTTRRKNGSVKKVKRERTDGNGGRRTDTSRMRRDGSLRSVFERIDAPNAKGKTDLRMQFVRFGKGSRGQGILRIGRVSGKFGATASSTALGSHTLRQEVLAAPKGIGLVAIPKRPGKRR